MRRVVITGIWEQLLLSGNNVNEIINGEALARLVNVVLVR